MKAIKDHLQEAVHECIKAAGHEFEPVKQRSLIKVCLQQNFYQLNFSLLVWLWLFVFLFLNFSFSCQVRSISYCWFGIAFYLSILRKCQILADCVKCVFWWNLLLTFLQYSPRQLHLVKVFCKICAHKYLLTCAKWFAWWIMLEILKLESQLLMISILLTAWFSYILI